MLHRSATTMSPLLQHRVSFTHQSACIPYQYPHQPSNARPLISGQTSHAAAAGANDTCCSTEQPHQPGSWVVTAAKLSGMVVLGSLWLMGRPGVAPAAAGVVRPPAHLETLVTIAPQASITAATVTHDNDSNCAMLMAVCLGFWMISATISAGVGIIMKLAGRPMAYASSNAGWTSAGVMDTLDIMQLPLAFEEEPLSSSSSGSVSIRSATRDTNVTYLPWDGPDTYIPVSMVKVFQPGMLEAGRVARPSLLQTDLQGLSIISVTRRADADQLASRLPGNSNGNGNGNGSKNGKSSSNGSNGKQQQSSEE